MAGWEVNGTEDGSRVVGYMSVVLYGIHIVDNRIRASIIDEEGSR